MTTVTTTDFQSNPAPYQEAAMREPVTITTGGRERLVLLSAAEYQRLKLIEDILAGRQKPAAPDQDPLAQLFAQLHARIQAERPINPDEVTAELTAYNDENRH